MRFGLVVGQTECFLADVEETKGVEWFLVGCVAVFPCFGEERLHIRKKLFKIIILNS